MRSHEQPIPFFPLMLAEEMQGNGEVEAVSPYDQTPIARVAKAGALAVEAALQAETQLHNDRDNWLPQPKRVEILRKAASIIRSRKEELTVESAREGEKPLVDSLVEVDRAADCLDVCVDTLHTHAGQVCVPVQRCFVEASIATNFAERLAAQAKQLNVGDPTLGGTEVGPLINTQEVDRVHQRVREAVDGGAELLCGGQKISETCYSPTVLLNVPPDCRLSNEEVFGPVVCVYSYAKLDEAIARANDVPFSFQASVYGDRNETIRRATQRLNAAAVIVNDHTAFRVDWMPFAGLKESGYGIGGIPYTMNDMRVEKLIVFKSAELN